MISAARSAVYAGNDEMLKTNGDSLMLNKNIPDRVALREERTWVPNGLGPRDPDTTGNWEPYRYREDAELRAILQHAEGDPHRSLQGWYRSARNCIRKKGGAHLIPGPLQVLLQLPVRQVYIHDDAIYRIEADGQVTTKLM